MKGIGARIKELRESRKLTQQQFADALGVSRGAVGNWERDLGIKTENIAQIASTFGAPFQWIAEGVGPNAVGETSSVGETAPLPPLNAPNASQPEPADFSVTVPVYGQVVGGSEGYFVFNGERLDDILAPSSLRGIKDAYAVYVAGTSMEPRYFAGEAVFVNPRRPVRPGDFVVVQVLEGNEHNHELHCYVKQYKGQKNGDYLFWQFNPNQEVKFPKDHVSKIHKIIGTGEG